MRLRYYQLEALEACREAYNRGVHRMLISLPTGTGKTVILCSLPQYVLGDQDDCTVILVNREELVTQTVEKIGAIAPGATIGVEKGPRQADGTETYVVASVQTLHKNRIDNFFERLGGRIGLIIADEAHHATADQYSTIFERFSKERPEGLVVGVTATPQRGDGIGLGAIFHETVYHRDMQWAMNDGWLVPLRCYNVTTDVNLDHIAIQKTNVAPEGDFAPEQLAEAIDIAKRNLIAVSAYLRHTPGRKGIVFTPTLTHAEHLSDTFRAAGVKSEYANGTFHKSERDRIIAHFRRGSLQMLVNVALYLEGFDVPDVEVLVAVRPTKSRALYIQMTGRVLRPHDDTARELSRTTTAAERRDLIARSPKPFATVLDLVDQTRKQGLITLPTLWGLPPKLMLSGQDLETVTRKVQQLESADPTAVADLRNFEQIDTTIQEVSAFTPPPVDERISAISSLAWRTRAESDYSLDLPNRLIGRDHNGNLIKNFAQLYRACEEEARNNLTLLEQILAQKLPHDPTSVYEIQESVRIHLDTDGRYRAEYTSNGHSRTLGYETTMERAFGRAERWIEHNRSDVISALSARAPWRARRSTMKQIELLKTRFHVPLHLIPNTQGEADMLIKQLLEGTAIATNQPPLVDS